MALGADYVTVAELEAESTITDADDDVQIGLAITAATLWINQYCARDFNSAGSATARVYYPENGYLLKPDDISTTTGLVVKTDEGDDGTFETTWAASDYQLEPLNGVSDGMTGWPYTSIRAVESRCWPTSSKRAPVEITADWGWPAVPEPVKKACMIRAAALYRRKHSPEGLLGGFDDFGPTRVSLRLDPDIEAMLAPYRRHPVLVA